MLPHDAYFIIGVIFPLLSAASFFSALSDSRRPWVAMFMMLIGLGSLWMAWDISQGQLSLEGFGNSVLRMIAMFLKFVVV